MRRRRYRWIPLMLCVLPALVRAQVSDQEAAVLMYPYVVADHWHGAETAVQLTNASTAREIQVHCLYINANHHCSNSGDVCQRTEDCLSSGICVPGWNTTDFHLQLTPRQPLSWQVSQGREASQFPCLPPARYCDGSNAGSLVPPVPEDPFVGALVCYAVDAAGKPADLNVLRGEATITHGLTAGVGLDIAKYNAVGFRAVVGNNNGDDTLTLGGVDFFGDLAAGAEYAGCPGLVLVPHLLDGATEPALGNRRVFTRLVLLPCSFEPGGQAPPSALVGYTVDNDFGQRFTGFFPLADGFFVSRLSDVNATVFSATGNSTTALTRLSSPTVGLVALLVEEQVDPSQPDRVVSAAINVPAVGTRASADYIGPKPAVCGDGVLDPGEGCDNATSGGCCSDTCQPLPAGQTCLDDDNNDCTRDQCNGQGLCTHAPLDPLPASCGCCRFSAPWLGPTACAGDCDGDGQVSPQELQVCTDLAAGKRSVRCACDVNNDLIIDANDLSVVAANQRYGCPATANICLAPVDPALCTDFLSGTLVSLSACDRTDPAAAAADCPSLPGVPTATPTSTVPTATPTVPPPCPGDCDGNRRVGVDELLVGVDIALGQPRPAGCQAFDADRNGRVTVDKLVAAVNAALNGCP